MKLPPIARALLFGVLIIYGVWTSPAQDKASDLAIIVNKASKLEDVAFTDLQRYFKAEKSKTPDGTKLVIAMMDAGRPERDAALRAIFKMNETEYADFFVQATFTGAVATAPKAFPSVAAMKKFVADTPGAIGYVGGADVDDTVKALKVDGKAPGEAGFRLTLK